MKGKYCIVRTRSAGVHAGTVVSRRGLEVTLKDSRRIWYWKGALSCSELSLRGPQSGSKLADSVPLALLTEAIEIIPCAAAAKKQVVGFVNQ